jgi:uncharacterized protein (TIGR02231 family)
MLYKFGSFETEILNIKKDTMKRILLASVMLISMQLFATEKENVKSSISEVTVFTQGAQVYRKASYTVKPGITEIIIDGVCSTIDPKSLQVKLTGNVVLLDSKYSLYYPEPKTYTTVDGIPPKVKRDIHLLEDSMLVLTYDIQEIQDEIDVLHATKSILQNNGAIKGQGKVNDSIQLLKQAVEYYGLKMNELNKKLLSLNRKKNEKNNRKAEMNVRLTNLRNYQQSSQPKTEDEGPKHRVTITVSAKELASGKITFSYLVSQAGWIPMYDIRSDINTGKVNLNYKAQVYQNTGTNWNDVRLTISTNNPYQNKVKPTLHPWYIDYYTARPNPGSLNSNGYMAPAPVMVETLSSQKGYRQEADKVKDVDAYTSAQFTQVISQTISAEFKIDLPYTIESTNEKYMILISNTDLNATYKYYTAPKLDASVYLVAQISKLDELQLVPAKANIFFDGSYIGETYIDPTAMEDTLTLSLGRDPNLVVKRTLLKKDSKERIVSNLKERTNSFQIEVKNNKSINATIVVQDQIPITQNSEIIIEASDLGKAKHDKDTGLLEWELTLKPKEGKTLNFVYKVKFDKDKNL